MRWLMLFCFSFAHAAEPLQLPSPVNELKLIGQGRLHYFGFHVYDASSWSTSGQAIPFIDTMTFPFALQIRYAREIAASDLVAKTTEAWDELNLDVDEINRWQIELQSIWPDVKENDVIVCYVDQNEMAEFFVNGVSRGRISDMRFSRAFLSIWLHHNAEFKGLRNQLAGVVK